MNSFDELCKKLTQDVANTIIQGRSWNEAEQFRFDYAVRHLLIGLWKKHHTHPDNHSSMQKNKNFYSALKQYRDPQLTYRFVSRMIVGQHSVLHMRVVHVLLLWYILKNY